MFESGPKEDPYITISPYVSKSLLLCRHGSNSLSLPPLFFAIFCTENTGLPEAVPTAQTLLAARWSGVEPALWLRACPETWQLELRPAEIQVQFSSHDSILTLGADFRPPADPQSGLMPQTVCGVEPLESAAAKASALAPSSYPAGWAGSVRAPGIAVEAC